MKSRPAENGMTKTMTVVSFSKSEKGDIIMQVHYKGYELVPASIQRIETGEWPAAVTIFKVLPKTASIPFTTNTTFETQEEANEKSIEFGKQIIDGKHQGLSVSDL